MFTLISNEPIKIADLQKLTNQSMVNGALVTKMATGLLVKRRKTLVVWWSEEHGNMSSEKFISTIFRYKSKFFRGPKEQESWWCLDQISASTKFVLNFLQKPCMGTVFSKWTNFQISFLLWDLEVITDLLCVRKGYSWKILEQIVTVSYLKK